MRRQARLFAIAEYMRGRRTGVTAEILAERFSVTVRTIYRDLDALRDASLPLNADRGPGRRLRAEKAGGRVVLPKTDIGEPGWIAIIADSEGNRVGLHVHR